MRIATPLRQTTISAFPREAVVPQPERTPKRKTDFHTLGSGTWQRSDSLLLEREHMGELLQTQSGAHVKPLH